MNKDEFTTWAYDQFNKYDVRLPESFSAEEIIEHCPDIPQDFIRNHVRKRDERNK